MGKNKDFYNSPLYKRKQAALTRINWKRGVYNFLRKREKRRCIRKECKAVFEVGPSDRKKFCSRNCAMKVNNLKRSKSNYNMKEKMEKLYKDGFSMQDISDKIDWKYGKVVYWMKKFNVPRRSLSEAIYIKYNPEGNPFEIKKLKSREETRLFNLGIGLYLGEGDKRSRHVIKLANSDYRILRIFLDFLRKICNIKESKIKFELNIFDDIDPKKAVNFWAKAVGFRKSQLRTLTSRKSKGGSYKNKSKYGTLSVYVTNIKLKKIINDWCDQAVRNS